MLQWPSKDPNEVLDYQLNWEKALDGDTIVISQWTLPTGIQSSAEELTSITTTIWLEGGSEGITYVLLNRIITAGGRTMDQSVKLRLKTK